MITDIRVKSRESHAAGRMLYGLVFAMDPELVLEIGTNKGYTAICMALALKEINRLGFSEHNNAKIWTIDLSRRIQCRYCKIESDRLGLNDKIEYITGDSQTIEWNKEIDILFIDGDHSYNGILSDFLKYSPFVKREGIIVFHDTASKNVARVVTETILNKWDCIHIDKYPCLTLCQQKKTSITSMQGYRIIKYLGYIP